MKQLFINNFKTPDIMSPTEMREFWIDIKAEGEGLRIEVGRGEDGEGFMSRSWDQNPAQSWPLTHVAFAAWNNQVHYKFCLPGMKSQKNLVKLSVYSSFLSIDR